MQENSTSFAEFPFTAQRYKCKTVPRLQILPHLISALHSALVCSLEGCSSRKLCEISPWGHISGIPTSQVDMLLEPHVPIELAVNQGVLLSLTFQDADATLGSQPPGVGVGKSLDSAEFQADRKWTKTHRQR